MVKKSTLESILKEDMSDMWAILNSEEKRTLTDNFHIQTLAKAFFGISLHAFDSRYKKKRFDY